MKHQDYIIRLCKNILYKCLIIVISQKGFYLKCICRFNLELFKKSFKNLFESSWRFEKDLYLIDKQKNIFQYELIFWTDPLWEEFTCITVGFFCQIKPVLEKSHQYFKYFMFQPWPSFTVCFLFLYNSYMKKARNGYNHALLTLIGIMPLSLVA